jgi:hypothetical protein
MSHVTLIKVNKVLEKFELDTWSNCILGQESKYVIEIPKFDMVAELWPKKVPPNCHRYACLVAPPRMAVGPGVCRLENRTIASSYAYGLIVEGSELHTFGPVPSDSRVGAASER